MKVTPCVCCGTMRRPDKPCPNASCFLHGPNKTFARMASMERSRQRVLLAGMDCLPGQQDLFATDGEGSD